MNVQEMRQTVIDHLLGRVSDSNYGDGPIDRAARFALKAAIRISKANAVSQEITLAPSEYILDFSSDIDGWQAEWYSAGEIRFLPVRQIGYGVLAAIYSGGALSTLAPNTGWYIGWKTNDRALIWPTPSVEETMLVSYTPPLVEWTAGSQEDADLTTEINFPEELMDEVITLGIAPRLVDSSPGEQIARPKWLVEYYEWLHSIAGQYVANQGYYPTRPVGVQVLNFRQIAGPT